MRCYACQHVNSATARFCVECGAALLAATLAEAHPAPQGVAYAPSPFAGTLPADQIAGAQPVGYLYGYAPIPGQVPPGFFAYTQPQAPGLQPASAQASGGGVSMVSNVTVAPSPAASARTRGLAAGSDHSLWRALYFLVSGVLVGMLWFIGLMWRNINGYYNSDAATQALLLVLALVATIGVLLLNVHLLRRQRP